MIVRCLGNSTEYLVENVIDSRYLDNYKQYVHLDEVDLGIGQHYVVFGIAFRRGFPWYLVCGDRYDEYPKPHFSGFFELIDDRVPPNWSFRLGDTNVGDAAFLPTQWARDSSYLEKLVDGLPEARVVFDNIKREIEEWHSL